MYPAARIRLPNHLLRLTLTNTSTNTTPNPPQTRKLTTTPMPHSTTHDNPVIVNDPSPPSANPSSNPNPPAKPSTSAVPVTSAGAFDKALVEDADEGEEKRIMQAPNRAERWSRSQKPREQAMVGPRFEQTIVAAQPRPLSAMELIHRQPVNWTKKRQVSCNGGGGPLGHPRIFINVDKPQICWCTYCGLPFAHEHHRKMLEAQPSTTYPLQPTGDPAQIPGEQSPTGKPFEHR